MILPTPTRNPNSSPTMRPLASGGFIWIEGKMVPPRVHDLRLHVTGTKVLWKKNLRLSIKNGRERKSRGWRAIIEGIIKKYCDISFAVDFPTGNDQLRTYVRTSVRL